MTELCFSGGVHRGAEGVDKVEALALERADIVSEQGEHKRLLRLEYFESREWNPARNIEKKPDDEDRNTQSVFFILQKKSARDRDRYSGGVFEYGEQKSSHTVLFCAEYFFCHDLFTPFQSSGSIAALNSL